MKRFCILLVLCFGAVVSAFGQNGGDKCKDRLPAEGRQEVVDKNCNKSNIRSNENGKGDKAPPRGGGGGGIKELQRVY